MTTSVTSFSAWSEETTGELAFFPAAILTDVVLLIVPRVSKRDIHIEVEAVLRLGLGQIESYGVPFGAPGALDMWKTALKQPLREEAFQFRAARRLSDTSSDRTHCSGPPRRV